MPSSDVKALHGSTHLILTAYEETKAQRSYANCSNSQSQQMIDLELKLGSSRSRHYLLKLLGILYTVSLQLLFFIINDTALLFPLSFQIIWLKNKNTNNRKLSGYPTVTSDTTRSKEPPHLLATPAPFSGVDAVIQQETWCHIRFLVFPNLPTPKRSIDFYFYPPLSFPHTSLVQAFIISAQDASNSLLTRFPASGLISSPHLLHRFKIQI